MRCLLVVRQLPPPNLSANARRRMHPMLTRELVQEASAEWYELLVTALWEQYGTSHIPESPWEKVRINYTITWPNRRWLDYDNLQGGGLKVIADLLQGPQNRFDKNYRLGIIKDDSPKCLVEAPRLVYAYEKNKPSTSIEIIRCVNGT